MKWARNKHKAQLRVLHSLHEELSGTSSAPSRDTGKESILIHTPPVLDDPTS